MNTKFRTIEVDDETAEALESLAKERQTSVPELVRDLVASDQELAVERACEIAELDRRWAKARSGGRRVPHEEVVGWLHTWGTGAFRLRRDQ